MAKLEGAPGYIWHIASSVYEPKTVHYLSMVSNKVKWIVKEQLVYNVETKR